MKKILMGFGLVFLALIAVLLINTLNYKSRQLPIEAAAPPNVSEEALKHFKQSIGYQTISYSDSSRLDSAQFLSFHRFLKSTYPRVHARMTLEKVARYSLLYRWEGKNPALGPVILMAHQDVVPVEEATRNKWSVDPFEGVMKEDFIWGRGTADDKINLIGILETAEKLLIENFQPERTVYLAFGHNEELGGSGARAIAKLLESRGVKADLVLDEGGIITNDKVPGITKPVALIGTSEKGYLSIVLTAEQNGGHSSMPAPETSIDILTKAISTLREHPFPASLSPSTAGLLNSIGPEMPFFKRIVFANQWLFSRMIIGIYEKSDGGNAMVRTTIAPTLLQAGVKDNVIPTIAKATINFRLLPGDSVAYVMAYVRKIINDDRVNIEALNEFIGEPTGVTDEDNWAFKRISATVKKTFPNTITSPFLMIGGTDSRFFNRISSGIIKFSPMVDPIGFHGIDERVSVGSYQSALWFYETLVRGL